MEWQPIETAPRDGTEFLAWSVCTDVQWTGGVPALHRLIFWSDKWGDWADSYDGDPAAFYPPTHWMPLPEPPKTEGA